ncbi:hypothetical protein [Streptomyces hydrogenans]|uniref:hypothetical protein n=1 Tax=Streptomyces hydrogenans TaxID=1873719 RepID=UPI0036EC85F1
MPKTPDAPPAQPADDTAAAKLARLRARARPIAKVTICDDEAVRRDLEQAKAEYAQAESYGTDESKTAAAGRLEAAQAAFDEAAIVLAFQALPRTEFKELKEKHPPTEEQAEDGQTVNVETFGPELIAACSQDGLTVEDAASFLTDWAEGEAAQLFYAAYDIQSHQRSDLGKG